MEALAATTYVYDGSFEGLLSAYQAALDAGVGEAGFDSDGGGATGWLFDNVVVTADARVARELLEAVARTGGRASAGYVVHTFLSEAPGFEPWLYRFTRLTFEKGRCVADWHSHDVVRRVARWVQQVGQEAHRFTGLLRFMKLRDGTLYAPYAPGHNITTMIARHFQSRLRNERWVIHDRKREIAVAWDGEALLPVADVPRDIVGLLDADEVSYQRLWRLFAERVAIDSRANPDLQRKCMPQRYWRYLPEMRA